MKFHILGRNFGFFCELYSIGGKNMRSISVEPDRLESAAASIESADSDYNRICQAMYGEVDKMSINWQGKDNEMFVSQIRAFEDDLKRISMAMREYAEFLRTSARAYREAQDEICSRAAKL